MWTTFHLGHYVPLSWMTLGLDYSVWGMDARGYHLTNVLLHATGAILLYAITRRVLTWAGDGSAGDGSAAEARASLAVTGAALAAALLFALHPLRVESVAWVTERRDVLSGCLALASAYAYLRSLEREAHSRRWYGTSLLLFAGGVLSKATVLTLPTLLLVLNVYPLRRLGGSAGWWTPAARGVYARLAPYALIAGGIALLSFVALPRVPQLPIAGKLAVSLYSLAFYLWKTVAPFDLAPLYSLPLVLVPTAPRFLLAAAVVVALAAVVFLARRRWPGVPAAAVAFVLALLPMLGVHQNGPQISADRYTYHAAPVLSLLVAGALLVAWRSRYRRGAVAASVAVLLALGTLTWRQSRLWTSSEALWAQVVRVDPDGWIGPNNLGNALMPQERFTAAERYFRRATELNPAYDEAFNNLGVALARQSRAADAVPEFERALTLRPSYAEAAVNLGAAFGQLGDPERAITEFQRALAIDARNTAAQINWGNALLRLQRPLDAIPHYQAALTIDPANRVAQQNLDVARAMAARLSAPR